VSGRAGGDVGDDVLATGSEMTIVVRPERLAGVTMPMTCFRAPVAATRQGGVPRSTPAQEVDQARDQPHGTRMIRWAAERGTPDING
jgi:hypothetical protein